MVKTQLILAAATLAMANAFSFQVPTNVSEKMRRMLIRAWSPSVLLHAFIDLILLLFIVTGGCHFCSS